MAGSDEGVIIPPSGLRNPVLRRILGAFLTVAGATLLIKGLAFLKDLVVAHQLGVGDGMDAFLIALMMPSLLAALVGRAAANAVVPVLLAVRQDQGEHAARCLSATVLLLGAGLLGVSVLALALTLDWLIPLLGARFNPAKLALTLELSWILLPVLWFTGMSFLSGALLNARERFALVALAPGIIPALVLVSLLALGMPGPVRLMALATALGAVLEWLLLMGVLWRRGLLGRPCWDQRQPLGEILQQLGPLMASNGMMVGIGLVDQSMAALLPAGSVASLNYARKVPALLTNLGVTALGVALLPHFSAMVANRDWPLLRATARRVMVVTLAVVLPGTALLWLLSADLVSLLFQRGAFGPEEVPVVAFIQQLLLLQIPFFFVAMVLRRLALACGGGRLILINSILSLCLNALFNLLFIPWLGVAGIALSTAVASAIGCCFLALRLGPLLRVRMAVS